MTDETDRARDESTGLYVGWDELHRRTAPRLGRDRFRAVIKGKMDREGFPPFHEEWAGWYWPKVQLWLDSTNEVAADGFVEHAQDGAETFDAPTRTRARPQAREAPAAILDRQTGRERPQGVSRRLHSVASRG